MAKNIYLFARKVHRFLALPMILLIAPNKLTAGTPIGIIVVPIAVTTMMTLAVTGGYMWFWMYFQRTSRRKSAGETTVG
ncbi:hypothetical protein SY88_05290 [Clostridiales bacterium PH28_bin88]|nr:hypothetical protein SY88_05290 [Clostridiales bacterium PH28_bin88]